MGGKAKPLKAKKTGGKNLSEEDIAFKKKQQVHQFSLFLSVKLPNARQRKNDHKSNTTQENAKAEKALAASLGKKGLVKTKVGKKK